jgi:hypothetical protein
MLVKKPARTLICKIASGKTGDRHYNATRALSKLDRYETLPAAGFFRTATPR